VSARSSTLKAPPLRRLRRLRRLLPSCRVPPSLAVRLPSYVATYTPAPARSCCSYQPQGAILHLAWSPHTEMSRLARPPLRSLVHEGRVTWPYLVGMGIVFFGILSIRPTDQDLVSSCTWLLNVVDLFSAMRCCVPCSPADIYRPPLQRTSSSCLAPMPLPSSASRLPRRR